MAFQSVANTIEIDVIFTLNGELVQNVFYAELPGDYLVADLQAVADAVDLSIAASWQDQQPAEAVYVRTECRGLEFENDVTAEQNLSNGPGTHAGSSLPNNVTFSIKKTSGLTGRSARGRSYWVGVPSTILQAANENLVTGAWATNVVAAIGDTRIAINGVGLWQAVLVSRFTAGAARVTGKTFPWTGETSVDQRVDTNRGRLPTL